LGCFYLSLPGVVGIAISEEVDCLLRLALASVLFLSMSAASQTATPVENVRPEVDRAAATAPTPVPDLPEAPSAIGGSSNSDDAPPMTGMHFVATTVEGRSYNGNPRTLDSRFILLQALSAVALVTDVETTVRDLQGSKSVELNPLFGQHPTRARLYGINVPLNLLSFYVSYRYKKREPQGRAWKVGPALFIAVHTAAAINNLVVGQR
jgi:hypothetical protein